MQKHVTNCNVEVNQNRFVVHANVNNDPWCSACKDIKETSKLLQQLNFRERELKGNRIVCNANN